MKKLICAKDIEALVKQGQKTLCIDANTIFTPSAKDALRAAKIEIFEGKAECGNGPCEESPWDETLSDASLSEETSREVSLSEASLHKESPCEDALCEDEITGDLVYSVLKAVLGI